MFATCLKNEEFWACHLSFVPTTYRKARKVNRTSATESISCTRLGPFLSKLLRPRQRPSI